MFNTSVTADKGHRAVELLIITARSKLKSLETDENYMVDLNKFNSNTVEKLIKEDPDYPNNAKFTFDQQPKDIKNWDNGNYYNVIKQIAVDNSTRTSDEALRKLANYCGEKENRFFERLCCGEPELVDEMVVYLTNNGYRREKSLCSKVCKYICEWAGCGDKYAINDSIVRRMLPYYLKMHNIDVPKNEKLDNLSYVELCEFISQLKEATGLSFHKLDHLIWYCYKNDPVRMAIAGAIVKQEKYKIERKKK